ncbi:disease resistance protein At4g27190-like [Hibiscus syriacus]|uniref:disease resistance protein At4g27190-like n=1 Tax=Hibiscus syriacus TaxID=106335 RepID=UPI0019240671|nr:disease resistance protein At4g27190-like [Hibiscus syriacus]
MAEGFCLAAASNAVGTLMVDYLVKPIERRIRYLFRFPKLVRDFRQQQNNLNREQTRINEDVKEAKLHIQTQVIGDHVNEWLTDAENAVKEAQSMESKIEENKRCFCWCPNWSWRYRLGKEIEKKTEVISKLVEGSHFERIGYRAVLPGLEFFTSKDLVASKTSTAAFNKVMEALKDDEVDVIGVWGMGGVGKTTLVTEVGKRAKELQLFQVIKVVVSQTPSIGDIQKKLADFLNIKFEKTTKEGKAEELWLRLAKEEKVLNILDDMWNEVDLKEIGLPIKEKGKGCRVILTTRRKTVCEAMECQITVPIDVLDGDEAWALFRMKAELDERVPRDIIEEAKKVAEECKGLPVAIVTLARALKGTKTRDGWEMARKKLASSRLLEIGNIEEEEKNAYQCIKMSYDYLKKETVKRCFLLCAVYPEDHSIHTEGLVRYAWGLEFYDNIYSVEEVRIQVLEAIDYLKDSCFLLQDEDGAGHRDITRYIKLHEVVRDVALWITSKEESDFMIKSRLQLLNDSLEPCKAISLLDSETKRFPEKLVCPKLEFQFLKNCYVQGICFQGMQEAEIEGRILFSLFFSFRSLFLSLLRAFQRDASSSMPVDLDGREVLESLEQLRVTGFEQLQEVFRDDEENEAPPLLSNIEHLKLESFSELRWIVKVPTHSVSFQGLSVLETNGCNQLKYLFSLSAIQTIRSLQELHIVDCDELKSVFMESESSDGDQIESGTLYLPNLKTVVISSCPNAEYVFPLALAGGLPCLQEIQLSGLENLSSFFAENNIVEAPALEILLVLECPRFTVIVEKEANKSVSLKIFGRVPSNLQQISEYYAYNPAID